MTDTTQTEGSAPAEKAPKTPKRGIGTVIKEAILAGKTNEEALAAAKAEFPDAGTTASTVSWYRNQLRKDGHADVPTARELKKKAADKAKADAEAQAAAAQTASGEAPADPLA
ncbi:hypothetical protein RCRUDOLPH_49 [Rhodobacter phage RcRudolph]|nr:hypothetical protein RCRUDOLPH_49 [Rhodobacter phage RcRudolph]